MPIGYLSAVAIVAVYAVAALWPRRRPRPMRAVSFALGHLINELPFVGLAWLVAWTLVALVAGDLETTGGLVVLGAAALTAPALVEIARRGALAGRVVEGALDRGLGPGWRSVRDPFDRPGGGRLARILLAPFPLRTRGVRRIRNVAYGDAGRRNRLDLYRPRRPPAGGSPVLIHFHGGHFRIGGKSREARPLLHRLASQGWLCASATYRLRAAGRFPNSLIDAKRAIAWVRRHAHEHGADPSLLIAAGSSAGGHLAAMAALTPGDPALQPGFEDEDASVAAAVGLYGYYGRRTRSSPRPSSPVDCVGPDAPPFFLAHAGNDTNLPEGSAEAFVEALRERSERPVVYAELPGAQHSFDLFRSLRFERVVDGIEAFAAWVRASARRPAP
jgi:acetyl esterase/lipase